MPDDTTGRGGPTRGRKPSLHKLGLARDIDLALHLPLRYEDETRIVKLRDAREGDIGADRGDGHRLRDRSSARAGS